MVKLRNGQIVEMCCYSLKTELLGHSLLIGYVNILAFSCLYCRESISDVFSVNVKNLLINSTINQTEHSSILLCISDMSNAEEISIG